MGKNKMVTKVDKKTGERKLTKHGKSIANKIKSSEVKMQELKMSLCSAMIAYRTIIAKTIMEHKKANPFHEDKDLVVIIPQEAIKLLGNNPAIKFEKHDELTHEVINDITTKIEEQNNIVAQQKIKNALGDYDLNGEFELQSTQSLKHKFKELGGMIYGNCIVIHKSELEKGGSDAVTG